MILQLTAASGQTWPALAIPSFREQILALFRLPDLAVTALIVGLLLVYLEFNLPGRVVAGATGTLLVTLSLYGLLQQQLRVTAVLVLLGGVASLLAAILFQRRQLLAVPGAALIVFGLFRLVEPHTAVGGVHLLTAFTLGTIFSVSTVALGRIALQARRNKQQPGSWQ